MKNRDQSGNEQWDEIFLTQGATFPFRIPKKLKHKAVEKLSRRLGLLINYYFN